MSQADVYRVRTVGRDAARLFAADTPRVREDARDGHEREGSARGRTSRSIPSWLTSIWLHAGVLAAVLFTIPEWHGSGRRGEADGDPSINGLLTRLEPTSDTDAAPGEITFSTPSAEPTVPVSDLPSIDPTADELPPVDLASLPGTELPPVEGPGAASSRFSPPPAAGSPATPGGGGISEGSAPPGGLARGETSFLGVRDAGETFVYVIDVSGSMSDHDAIKVAKRELMASLAPLRTGQRFQVIFYNEKPTALRLPGRTPQKLYDATDLNKTLARQFIGAVQADLGTKHMLALHAALDIQPDVIFFLTDADDPALTAKDLDEIRKANTGGTRIHAIEFGKGAKLDGSKSLERLAGQNHGGYRYWDVTR